MSTKVSYSRPSQPVKGVVQTRPPRVVGTPLRAHLTTRKFPVDMAGSGGQLRVVTKR